MSSGSGVFRFPFPRWVLRLGIVFPVGIFKCPLVEFLNRRRKTMSEPAKKKIVYDDLYSICENMTGEIVNGELIVTPRPSQKHVHTASALDKKIGSPYQLGEGGGPGGWVILVEPEVKFGEDVVVPDLAGWKKERYPRTGRPIGSPSLPIGCARCSHRAPCVWIESKKCPSTANMECHISG